jgi:4-aminobutyrate aminotransferase-like enzyme
MLPPLTVSAAEIDRAADILGEVFASVEQAVHA